jgi:predicted small lipoprotein YifL
VKKLLSALVCLGLVISMGAVIGCGDKKPETKPADTKAEKKDEKKT